MYLTGYITGSVLLIGDVISVLGNWFVYMDEDVCIALSHGDYGSRHPLQIPLRWLAALPQLGCECVIAQVHI